MTLNAPPPHQNNMMEKEELCYFALSIATYSSLLMVLKAIIKLDGCARSPSLTRLDCSLATHEEPGCNHIHARLHAPALPNDGPIERLYRFAPAYQSSSSSLSLNICFGPMRGHRNRGSVLEKHHLKDAVLGGDSAFKKAHGMTLFEYFGTDMRFSKVFNDAMLNYSTITMKKMLENCNGFDDLSTLVDVGGGPGQTLNMIIAKYPTIRGVNFDLAHVIKDAPKYDGVEQGGMFVGVPKGDAIFTKEIYRH
ncbi:hypothetical protein Cgig2_029627 [Carnegiea gigantea]|uniref:O-methyltransferase C-terminal domain-containing protein n=1 Tax=Carnegiea gigantea TaxID=171969 RepID=A0A9Q1KI86_9CARY|nr:hypothetical protein Cgig2_029627 [Carnegiea gigantea]